MCYHAYSCLKRGLSAEDYKAMAQSAYSIGGQLPDGYRSHTFYAEMTDAASHVLFTRVLTAVKRSPVLAVAADEGPRGCNYLSIRVHYLDSAFMPCTELWQVRKLFRKDHDELCKAVVKAFTESPDGVHVPHSTMLSEKEFADKLVGLTADGAPVMGAQRQAHPLSVPMRGSTGNLAFSLLECKARHSSAQLLVAWCCPHRLDLTAGEVERHPATGPILQMVRRLAAHVANHPAAKGQLSALHHLFTGDWNGGAAALHLAPHRFLSHATPTSQICDSVPEVLAYIYGILAKPSDERMRLWALGMRDSLLPLQVHLLLAACADLLGILRRANLRT